MTTTPTPPVTVPTTPSAARRARIRALSVLVQRASSELAHLLQLDAQLERQTYRVEASVPADELSDDVEPSRAPGKLIRAWAIEQGLLENVTTGRIRTEIRKAFTLAGEPGYHPTTD